MVLFPQIQPTAKASGRCLLETQQCLPHPCSQGDIITVTSTRSLDFICHLIMAGKEWLCLPSVLRDCCVTPDVLCGFCEAIGKENVWQKTQPSLETGVQSLLWTGGFHQL